MSETEEKKPHSTIELIKHILDIDLPVIEHKDEEKNSVTSALENIKPKRTYPHWENIINKAPLPQTCSLTASKKSLAITNFPKKLVSWTPRAVDSKLPFGQTSSCLRVSVRNITSKAVRLSVKLKNSSFFSIKEINYDTDDGYLAPGLKVEIIISVLPLENVTENLVQGLLKLSCYQKPSFAQIEDIPLSVTWILPSITLGKNVFFGSLFISKNAIELLDFSKIIFFKCRGNFTTLSLSSATVDGKDDLEYFHIEPNVFVSTGEEDNHSALLEWNLITLKRLKLNITNNVCIEQLVQPITVVVNDEILLPQLEGRMNLVWFPSLEIQLTSSLCESSPLMLNHFYLIEGYFDVDFGKNGIKDLPTCVFSTKALSSQGSLSVDIEPSRFCLTSSTTQRFSFTINVTALRQEENEVITILLFVENKFENMSCLLSESCKLLKKIKLAESCIPVSVSAPRLLTPVLDCSDTFHLSFDKTLKAFVTLKPADNLPADANIYFLVRALCSNEILNIYPKHCFDMWCMERERTKIKSFNLSLSKYSGHIEALLDTTDTNIYFEIKCFSSNILGINCSEIYAKLNNTTSVEQHNLKVQVKISLLPVHLDRAFISSNEHMVPISFTRSSEKLFEASVDMRYCSELSSERKHLRLFISNTNPIFLSVCCALCINGRSFEQLESIKPKGAFTKIDIILETFPMEEVNAIKIVLFLRGSKLSIPIIIFLLSLVHKPLKKYVITNKFRLRKGMLAMTSLCKRTIDHCDPTIERLDEVIQISQTRLDFSCLGVINSCRQRRLFIQNMSTSLLKVYINIQEKLPVDEKIIYWEFSLHNLYFAPIFNEKLLQPPVFYCNQNHLLLYPKEKSCIIIEYKPRERIVSIFGELLFHLVVLQQPSSFRKLIPDENEEASDLGSNSINTNKLSLSTFQSRETIRRKVLNSKSMEILVKTDEIKLTFYQGLRRVEPNSLLSQLCYSLQEITTARVFLTLTVHSLSMFPVQLYPRLMRGTFFKISLPEEETVMPYSQAAIHISIRHNILKLIPTETKSLKKWIALEDKLHIGTNCDKAYCFGLKCMFLSSSIFGIDRLEKSQYCIPNK
eukprot:snap_masked-scaffold_11-processed-gene-0.15-mRNA-1 protein AED:1.00 eAED:1.00 QI:0/0/0/0/1/1/2/0/1083